jgi:transposase
MSKQQRYTPEFKTEAVKLVLEQGIQQSLAARRLSIPEGTLATWVAAAKSATSAV